MWDDIALKASFYSGLKDDVKDKLVRVDLPDTLDELMNMVIKINGRLYERRQEKQHKGERPYIARKANAKAPRQQSHWDPMDLDATKGKPAPRFKPTPLSPTGYKNPRDKSKDTCAKYKKKGHWARDYRLAPPQRLNAISGSPKGTSDTKHPDYSSML